MIRLATPADSSRVFHLLCCAKGAQCPYPAFERTFGELLASGERVCLVAESPEGFLWGYIALRPTDPDDSDDPLSVSELAVTSRMHGLQAWFIARAYRLASALRHCGRIPLARGRCQIAQAGA